MSAHKATSLDRDIAALLMLLADADPHCCADCRAAFAAAALKAESVLTALGKRGKGRNACGA